MSLSSAAKAAGFPWRRGSRRRAFSAEEKAPSAANAVSEASRPLAWKAAAASEEELEGRELTLTLPVQELLEAMNRASEEVNDLEQQVARAQAQCRSLALEGSASSQRPKVSVGQRLAAAQISVPVQREAAAAAARPPQTPRTARGRSSMQAASPERSLLDRVQRAAQAFGAAAARHLEVSTTLHTLEVSLASTGMMTQAQQDSLMRHRRAVVQALEAREKLEKEHMHALEEFSGAGPPASPAPLARRPSLGAGGGSAAAASTAATSEPAATTSAPAAAAAPAVAGPSGFSALLRGAVPTSAGKARRRLASRQRALDALTARHRVAKQTYSRSMRSLDEISEAVHRERQAHRKLVALAAAGDAEGAGEAEVASEPSTRASTASIGTTLTGRSSEAEEGGDRI